MNQLEGYADVPILETNADLDAVRKSPKTKKEFEEIVEEAKKNAATK